MIFTFFFNSRFIYPISEREEHYRYLIIKVVEILAVSNPSVLMQLFSISNDPNSNIYCWCLCRLYIFILFTLFNFRIQRNGHLNTFQRYPCPNLTRNPSCLFVVRFYISNYFISSYIGKFISICDIYLPF